jgi:NTE family protein
MRNTRLICIVAAVMALALVSPLAAQEPPPKNGKLVLVLSGGGARGFAHIGALRVLEELDIAPDLIVGTSMGSVVGGLYAAGWSPDEIEELVKTINWEEIFTDRLERKYRSFRRKQDDYPVMIQGRLHFDGLRLVLPPGVIDGQRLDLVLRSVEALSPTAANFDDLPIPFRAVASNIATGQAVVLDSGSLATAIRASMSVPGALPPVTIDGQELVDGGIAANLPIGIAKELGATRIIAVNISSPLLDESDEQFETFMAVFTHLNSLLTAGNVDRDMALLGADDLLISPDLGDITFVSFDRAEQAIAIGEKAAHAKTAELKKFSASEQRWAEFSRRERATPLAPLEVDRVRLDNTSKVDNRLIRKAMAIDPPQTVDREFLVQDLLGLFNLRYFDVIGFQFEEVEPQVKELVVTTPPPSYGRGSLQFGLGFTDDFDGDSSYHLQARHQYLPANRRGGEWETLIQLGTVGGARTSFYQPLDWGMRWFVEPSLTYERGVQEIWLFGTAFAEYEFRTFDARVAAGRVLGRWGELSVAAFTRNDRGSPRIGSPEFDSEDEQRAGGQAVFRIDTEDSVVFPQSGADVKLLYTVSSDALGSEVDFEQIWGSASYAWTFGRNTVLPSIEYGENLEPIDSFFSAYFLGGLFRLSGLGRNELFGEKVLLARLLAYRRLFSFSVAGSGVRIYAGLSLEAGNTFFAGEPVTWDTVLKGGSVFIGGDTFIGPVIFAYGRTDGDYRTGGSSGRFYFAIGDRF